MNLHNVLVVLLIVGSAMGANDVIVKNLKLFVDGKEFIIKGMAYSPAPISFLNSVSYISSLLY